VTWEEVQSRVTPCQRCRATVRLAGPLSPNGRARVADALAAGRTLEIIGLIREDTRAGLPEAKNTYQHLVREAGKCHRCGTAISDGDCADCPHCEALNISV
jgi:hypothetical protein